MHRPCKSFIAGPIKAVLIFHTDLIRLIFKSLLRIVIRKIIASCKIIWEGRVRNAFLP